MGIYRLSGTTSRVQALKKALDTDIDNTDVMSEDWSADINVISGALKLWFRELPEPLLTYGLYHQFIEAASKYPCLKGSACVMEGRNSWLGGLC